MRNIYLFPLELELKDTPLSKVDFAKGEEAVYFCSFPLVGKMNFAKKGEEARYVCSFPLVDKVYFAKKGEEAGYVCLYPLVVELKAPLVLQVGWDYFVKKGE